MVAAAVLSGNRNFPGRVHALVDHAFLASPPLVVAFGLAGSVELDISREPVGRGRAGRAGVPQGPVAERGRDRGGPCRGARRRRLRQGLRGRERRAGLGRARSARPALASLGIPARPTSGARRSWRSRSGRAASRSSRPSRSSSWATTSRPTTSRPPGRSRPRARPADYLIAAGEDPNDLNVFSSRRGNYEAMVRGLFTNRSVRNLSGAGSAAGLDRPCPLGRAPAFVPGGRALPRRGRADGDSRRPSTTGPARRATGPPRARRSWACAPCWPAASSASTAPT